VSNDDNAGTGVTFLFSVVTCLGVLIGLLIGDLSACDDSSYRLCTKVCAQAHGAHFHVDKTKEEDHDSAKLSSDGEYCVCAVKTRIVKKKEKKVWTPEKEPQR
jgi:hypothetical protein